MLDGGSSVNSMPEDTTQPLNVPEDPTLYKRVAYKVGGRVMRAAKQILTGSVPAPQTPETLDIVAAFPNATRQYWIDVTVRSPHADRYNESASRNATNVVGYAASDGAKEKWQKYESGSELSGSGTNSIQPYFKI